MEKEFMNREQKIRDFWKKNDIFKLSMTNRKNNTPFVFYDGPPTANGMPHAGHVLGRVIKDLIARYKTMQGFYVQRKAGWDTHGLPVELGVEKKLGIKDKTEIENYGLENFIKECKKSVFVYEEQWRDFSEKIGYWVDMDNPYKTMDNTYIESVWSILADFHKRGLIYKGHKVTPYCPSCQTSLSSHEVAQGYKDVKDITVVAKFPLAEDEGSFLVWTTTPWSLPGNVALAVNPEEIYVKVIYQEENFVLMKELIDNIFVDSENVTIVSEHRGKELVGMKYLPPFNTLSEQESENAYCVISADFVTNKDGTGIVHIAPAYGEDDYKIVDQKKLPFINVVDSQGRYTENFSLMYGKEAKKSDVEIIKELTKLNLLFKKEKFEHSYPHCWRCDNPLIYYAMEGWFIKTTDYKQEIIRNNKKVNWYPEHIKDGRFGNFLENMVDWNIGRKRVWGTPLNIWKCSNCSNEYSPASIEDLKKNSINDVPSNIELHRPYVDNIKCKCKKCGSEMSREEEVIDVWFDSGAMPFAQNHYPFNKNINLNNLYPADFIAEGVDQTRGWFYSLLVISTMYKNELPYKNVLSLGHILDSEGRKMSKSKGNVISPIELMNDFGADALRWTLVTDSSPWNSKRFSENMVLQSKSKIIDTLSNIYQFYRMYEEIDNYNPSKDIPREIYLLDRWALSRMNSTIRDSIFFLDKYDPTSASRVIGKFINEISNWYIRRSRARFWAKDMNDDKKSAYYTLRQILINISRLLAPFTPYISEEIHLQIVGKSVHLENYPIYERNSIDIKLEKEMESVLNIVEVARSIRNSENIKTKQPLSNMFIEKNEIINLDFINKYESLIKEEMNIKNIELITSINEFVDYEIKPNFPSLGPKLGKDINLFQYVFKKLKEEEKKLIVNDFEEFKSLFSNLPIAIEQKDFIINKIARNDFALSQVNHEVMIILETTLSRELIDEGFVRELIRVIQQLRKKKNYKIEDYIDVFIVANPNLERAIENNIKMLKDNVLINNLYFENIKDMNNIEINKQKILIGLQ